MARFPRVVVVNIPHHITQRGNARQVILSTDADRATYLDLLREYSQLYGLSILGYCLMSNHVHLIAVPHAPDSLSRSLKHAHGRYASYWNVRKSASGHVWQGRFYSCPLDESHLWEAMRYVELNPVRAAIVTGPDHWRWSSARVHCGLTCPDLPLDMERWGKRWTAEQWRAFLASDTESQQSAALRQCTHTGRPFGTPEFVAALEVQMLRPLAARKGGRPKKAAPDTCQLALITVA